MRFYCLVLAFFIDCFVHYGVYWALGFFFGGIALGYSRWTRFMIVMTFDTP
jgi:hypothetical protein